MSIAAVPSAKVPPLILSASHSGGSLVPQEDCGLFARLSDRAQDDLRAWLLALAPLIREGRKPRHLTRRLADIAYVRGVAPGTARRNWDAWWQFGWKGLVNRSLAGTAWQNRSESAPIPVTQRKAFLEFVRLTFEQNQRSARAAYDYVLLPRLRNWRLTGDVAFAIPGYHTPPPNAEGKEYPAGWSYDNLIEHLGTRFELVSARIGRDAAYVDAPQVHTTRVGLYVGSHYSFDDKYFDCFVNSFAEGKAGRPMELCSRDLFSAKKVCWGVRLRVKGDDGKYKALTGMMARRILAATLFLHGYSPRGTVCIIEHGTATFPEWLREAITRLTGGLVTFSLSGMQGAVAHDGQYPGLGRGNPRHKASHESQNGYEHNVFGDLPGQTGKDVPHRPDGLGALLDANAALLAAREQLPVGRANALEFDLLELGEFMAKAHERYAQIDDNPNHNLTDWAQCGNLINQVWIDGQWRDLPDADSMDGATRVRLAAMLDAGTFKTRVRQMTRREVWDRGAGNLVKLAGHGVWEILKVDHSCDRTVLTNELAFEDAEIAPGKLRFWTCGVDAFGQTVELRDRETYRVVVNPFAPETAFVGDVAGRYIGEFPAIVRPTRATEDDPATQAAFGAAAQRTSELLVPLRQRHAGEAAAKDARQRHNARLTDLTKPATKEERATIKRQRQTAYRTDDFTAPADPEPRHPAPTQEAPAVTSGEGLWSEAETQPESDRPTRTQTYEASDFI